MELFGAAATALAVFGLLMAVFGGALMTPLLVPGGTPTVRKEPIFPAFPGFTNDRLGSVFSPKP